MYGWMDGWMDACMHACMHAWMDGWMDGWMHACMQHGMYVSICKNVYRWCQNYRTEVEEYEGTVIHRTLLFYNSVFLGR